MLVLARKIGERILIGDNIEVVVLEIIRGVVRFGIEAPRDVIIMRKEISERMKQENRDANDNKTAS